MLLHYTLNQLRGIDAWVGSKFDAKTPSLLVLGESDSGVKKPLATYVPDWIAGRVADKTFTAIFNACSASKSLGFNGLSKSDFWNAIAFYNFIPKSFHTASGRSPSPLALKSGIRPLHLVMDVLRPHGVFIVGLTHSEYSRPVIQAHGIPYVVIPHPRNAPQASFISKSFDILTRISTP